MPTYPLEVDSDTYESDTVRNMPVQLAIMGRPNVGKSTLLNSLTQQYHAITGPIPGLTRESVRAQYRYKAHSMSKQHAVCVPRVHSIHYTELTTLFSLHSSLLYLL